MQGHSAWAGAAPRRSRQHGLSPEGEAAGRASWRGRFRREQCLCICRAGSWRWSSPARGLSGTWHESRGAHGAEPRSNPWVSLGTGCGGRGPRGVPDRGFQMAGGVVVAEHLLLLQREFRPLPRCLRQAATSPLTLNLRHVSHKPALSGDGPPVWSRVAGGECVTG